MDELVRTNEAVELMEAISVPARERCRLLPCLHPERLELIR